MQELPPYPDSTILVVEVGSTAHGTGLPGGGRRAGRDGQLRRDSTGVGYDTKYAMHAARLGYQGIELLTTGQLVLPIGGEIGDWLRSVRRGEIPLADWERRVADLDRRLQSLAEDPEIPPGPDRERLVEWSIAAHRSSWGNPAVAHQA